MCRFLLYAIAGLTLIDLSSLNAYEYHGRIMTGAYFAKENFSTSTTEASSNDSTIVSSRFYLDVSKLGSQNLETIVDLRDKHDFFDKLDRERLELKARNRFQLRQLSLKLPSDGPGFYAIAGRFAVPEAGAVYTDGAELGWRWNSSMSSSLFGGLNPKRYDQTYLTFNRTSSVYGGYFLYQPSTKSWDESYYFTNALVVNQLGTALDRIFWHEQLIYQPDKDQRLIWYHYLDFVPRIYFQNLNANYRHSLGDDWVGDLGASVMDVIEYRRHQGIRERLEASPYREANAHARYKLSPNTSIDLRTQHGHRSSDSRWRHEYSFGIWDQNFLGPKFNSHIDMGYRNNFVSTDLFGRAGIGYYSRAWEVTWDEYGAYEGYNHQKNLYPIISDLEVSFYFSKMLYASLSFEHAIDSEVQLYSGFFKIGYRFGNREVPSVRESAPGKGAL